MITRYEVALNNVSLASIDNSIAILDVSHETPQFETQTANLAGRDGSVYLSRKIKKCGVTVSFEIHKYDTADRQSVCQSIVSWAKNGGILTVNDRPGQRLHCICESLPSIRSVKRWTDPITLAFAAYDLPYWEEEEPETLTLTGGVTSGELAIPGNAEKTFVNVEVTPTAALSTLTISAGGNTITLTSISVAANQKIVLDYTDKMVLRIRRGTTSLLNKRTAGSSDDLYVACGATNLVSVSADAPITAVFSARGLWL